MEYEIGDDPQGLPDGQDGDRDGGLREGRIILRGAAGQRAARTVEARDEEFASLQLGEFA